MITSLAPPPARHTLSLHTSQALRRAHHCVNTMQERAKLEWIRRGKGPGVGRAGKAAGTGMAG